ncbi:MAG: hypothetical protein A2X58_02785 [Nitrospirae bacterium GWC2_56_14]|nr:MAG: hypothetical protein A2X58_02785 [Nitrospirae bacterium GWC2_56_14]
MATITPFRGIIYNTEKAGKISDLVCPPYDIISPAGQQALYRKSPNNVIRLEYGLASPGDTEEDNRYTRAAAVLEDWTRSAIVKQEQVPAFYIYEMEYKVKEATRKLRGLICLVKLEDYDSGIIKPHETTLSGPKTDRLNLLRACKTSFSQIFSLFSDPQEKVAAVLARTNGKPEMEVKSSDGVTHRIWSRSDEKDIEVIVREMADKPIFIADGHHRYDTALNYRNEQRKAAGSFTGNEGFNYTAMFLARLEDPGLTVLPAHRAMFNLTDFHPQRFEDGLNQYFNIERIDFFDKRSENKDLHTVLDTMAHRADHAHIFGMRVKGEHSYYLLTLRNEADMDALLPAKSPAYRKLDVSILHHLIIDKLLGIRMETHKLGLNIEYIKDAAEADKRIHDNAAEIVFFMNPTKVREVKEVATAGERMPQKATYFFPKLLTGLVMHKLG